VRARLVVIAAVLTAGCALDPPMRDGHVCRNYQDCIVSLGYQCVIPDAGPGAEPLTVGICIQADAAFYDGGPDAGQDANVDAVAPSHDAGIDAPSDMGSVDAGAMDAQTIDAPADDTSADDVGTDAADDVGTDAFADDAAIDDAGLDAPD
jgi:hypothetical protein